ncbi:MAG: TatD family hydrolase [Pseudomonadota bacterium]
MLIDSHCHLNYLDDPDAALLQARTAGVEHFLCIGVSALEIEAVLAFTAQADVHATVGEHPGSCSGDASWVADYLEHDKVVALGEMGLDYHYHAESKQQARQRHTFAQQMGMAQSSGLPVVIHTRDAQHDTLDILTAHPDVIGVLHCFTESWEMAATALDMGYYVSISGIVTFNNADNVREVARQVPIDRLLIETDSPWLAPVPMRGKQNQPAYVAHTAEFLARLRGIHREELVAATGANFRRLFGL